MADSACLPASASDPAPPPDSDNAEGLSEMLMDSVTKDEIKWLGEKKKKKFAIHLLRRQCIDTHISPLVPSSDRYAGGVNSGKE